MSADGVVDSLCNAFLPDRRAVWDEAISTSGIAVKVRTDTTDSFCEPDEMVARMDELGIRTICTPASELGGHAAADPLAFERVALRWEEWHDLQERFPGRFAGLAVIDPTGGMAAVRATRCRLEDPRVVGLYLHTHSWDRRFDHADYYPFYAAASDAGVPVVVQAGASGGVLPSECGRPIGIDRPAIYFRSTPFVLSHHGWPWSEEAVALAVKFSNVYIGTGAFPPRRWPPAVREFCAGPGRAKVIFGTNFPTVGHRHALAQIDELGLDDATRAAVLGGTARAVFTRLGES